MSIQTVSLLNRVITRPKPAWVTAGISLLFFLAPIGVAHLDGSWESILGRGLLRPLLVPSVVIVYILVAAQLMAQSEAKALKAFRPVVLVNDDDFARIVRDASRSSRAGELIAFGAGALLGFMFGAFWLEVGRTIWLRLYGPLSQSFMMGLLGWTVYGSIVDSRLMAELHRQPLRVDLLDITPFEPMGRQSLRVALIFAGGVLLGAVFGLDLESLHSWQAWLFFLPMTLLPLVVFFLNMRPTHEALAGAKKRELGVITDKIKQAGRAIQALVAGDQKLGELAVEYTALIAYEARLRAAPTWPYNTAMLRTVFFSILVPALARGLSILLFGS